jgi:hypothetical protein
VEHWLELRSGHLAGNIVTQTQVFDPEKPVSLLFDAYAAIDKYVEVQAVAVEAWVGKGPIHQMKNVCARETTPGCVLMRVIIFALLELCFMGLHT